jgi:hypothetical protein
MSIIGSIQALEQPSILTYEPGRGARTVRVWRGAKAAIEAQYNQLAAAGWSVTLRYELGGLASVEASISAGGAGGGGGGTIETPEEVWTLQGNVVEKDILESDLSIIGGISDADKATIRQAIDSPDGNAPTLAGDAATVYKLMLNGARSVRVFQPMLTGSYLCTANYANSRSSSNVGRRFTNAQLVSLEGADTTLLVQLPASGAANRSDISVARGWVKHFPTVEQVGYDQYRVTVQYEYGVWSTVLYPDAS